MDQTLVASLRKNLEAKSTEELRRALESGEKAGKSPEELEALRQLLDERKRLTTKAVIATVSAVIVGTLGAGLAWWQLGAGLPVVVAGVVGAVLGFASWYIPNVIPMVRI